VSTDETTDRDPFELEAADRDPFEVAEMPEGWEPEDDEPFRIVIPEAADFIVTPVPVYDLLMSAPMAPDTEVVWHFLWRTAKRQGTISVWATNTYIAKGTHIGVRRIREAKAWMSEHRLIGYHQAKRDGGRLGKTFTTILPTAGTYAVPPVEITAGTPSVPAASIEKDRSPLRCPENRRDTCGTVSALGDSSSPTSCSSSSGKKEKERAGARVLSLSFAPLVQITEEEHQALLAKYGPELAHKALAMLSLYKHSHGASYNSDAGACESWAIDAARKRLAELQGKSAAPPSGNGSRRTCPKCGVAIHHNASYCLECRADLPGHEAPAARKEQAPPPLAADAATPEDVEAMRAAVMARKPQSTAQAARQGGAP
jgi:hypothetical protein